MMMWPWPDGDPFFTAAKGKPAAETLDVRLTRLVAQGLQADALTRGAARITVNVQNGVVLLDGTVRDAEVKQKAADIARGTPGVRDVCNALYSGESPGGGSDEHLQQLERLAAAATAEPAGSVRSTSGHTRRWLWLVAVSAVAAWGLLSVAILRYGWIAAVIGCLCAAVVTRVANTVRERKRDGRASWRRT